MKEIVDRAIPLLRELGEGRWSDMSIADRTALTSWIVMFVMSYEFADRNTARIPQSHRDHFRVNRTPPPSWFMAIGRAIAPRNTDGAFHRALRINDSNPGQVTAFIFGQLICFVFSSAEPVRVDFANFARSKGLQPVWPLSPESISSPLMAHTDVSYISLIDDFCTFAINDREKQHVSQLPKI